MEIFGSTETGAIASRRTVHSDSWFLYDRVKIKQDQAGASSVKGPQHEDWVNLSDHLNILDEHHFELLGRHTDMVKIAGKRASIADLSIKLVSIDGVIDGIIFHPDNDSSRVNRLIAFVIAPELTVKQVNQALVEMIDPVFLPRPVIKVDVLPRNETGKLTHSTLHKLYAEHCNRV
ncbi:MAG: acyl-CoA synthetase, partial [Gammaproteobacteria bacterium]|nr:acyl-CoA synthetase [Gammaproteobacteria bacterium]